MKKEIEIPDGYEIDQLTFKKVEKKLPTSWEEVKVTDAFFMYYEEIIALEKLLTLRDIYNGGWVADWTDIHNVKYVIEVYKGNLNKEVYSETQSVINFKTDKLRDLFFDTFTELLIIAKPLL